MFDTIYEPAAMTHMPFLTRDHQGKHVLLYCRSGSDDVDASNQSRRWKLWIAIEGDQPRRLATGLSEEMAECSPTAWHDDTGWHVTFIAGGARDNPLYHLYRMDGPTLDQLSQPVAIHPTRAGFVLGDRLVYADPENLIYVRQPLTFRSAMPNASLRGAAAAGGPDVKGQPSGDFDIELPGAFIYRVSYRADSPDRLLISGQWQTESDVFAIEADLDTGEQHLLECDGLPAYKCTVLDGQVLYAQRIGDHFENRRISESRALLRRPINTIVRRQPGQVQPIVTQPTGDCGCRGLSASRSIATTPEGAPTPDSSGPSGALPEPGPNLVPVTRASCVECLEKHLGAAYVLLTETRDGYAHRLRAIGHLHEAEDESGR